MSTQLRALDASRYQLTGELDFDNVQYLEAEGKKLIQQADSLTIDLSEVAKTSSAGLALLVSWLRYARQNNCALQYHAVPEGLIGLARVSGVEHFLA